MSGKGIFRKKRICLKGDEKFAHSLTYYAGFGTLIDKNMLGSGEQ